MQRIDCMRMRKTFLSLSKIQKVQFGFGVGFVFVKSNGTGEHAAVVKLISLILPGNITR